MKQVKQYLQAFVSRTSLIFLLFYVVLVLLPTLVFSASYAQTQQEQSRTEQLYEKQHLLQQSAQYITASLSSAAVIADTLQSSAPLSTLLSGGYASASDELYAYTAYIQPLFESILSANPTMDDMYLYRLYPSHIGNYGLVHALCDLSDLRYTLDPALDPNRGGTGSLLITNPADLFTRKEQTTTGAWYICLFSLYSADYTKVTAILELQLDLDAILTAALPETMEGEMYLHWHDQYYPVASSGSSYHLRSDALPQGQPEVPENWMCLKETVDDLELVYQFPILSGTPQLRHTLLMLLLLMLLPTGIFWVYLMYYSHRISRFSRHIHESGGGLPQPYLRDKHHDELGDVIREYNAMTQTIGQLIASVKEAERLERAANYYAMRSQVNPHSLFNTLENIRMHIEMEQYDDASQMLFMLGRFLRYNISMREESRLLNEIEHIQHYLCIYQYRMNNMLDFSLDLAEDLPNVFCPACILQPIVENCLKHGIRGLKDPLHIHVRACTQDGGILVDVMDDGMGMLPEDLDALNARMQSSSPHPAQQNEGHVGLENVNARIKYYYGPSYGLSFLPNSPHGLICRMFIGLEKNTTLQGGSKA